MVNPISSNGEQEVVSKTISEAPPTHYMLKIELFSLLAKNSMDKYESAYFEAGGYKWKLVLHPNGNKSKNVKEHISFYLSMAETSSLLPAWEVHAVFRLFLLDQNNDRYLILQDGPSGKERRFHRMKMEWGFDQFIPIKVFNDPSNGYLVDDTSVLGAEVFVRRERSTGRGECLSMVKEASSYKHLWRIENFSKLGTESSESKVFAVGNQKWKIRIYPNGKNSGLGSHVSLYMELADPEDVVPGYKVYANYTLRILDQLRSNHYFGKSSTWFSAAKPMDGWPRFVALINFSPSNAGYLVKDVCLVEAEITVLAVAKAL